MSLEVVKPDCAPRWNLERGRFVRRSLALLVPRNYVTKSNAVIEGAHFDDIFRLALRMLDGYARAVAVIDSFGVNAARQVSLIQLVSLDMADLVALAQIDAIDNDSHLRRFNHGLIFEEHAIAQTFDAVCQQLKLYLTIGTCDIDVARR